MKRQMKFRWFIFPALLIVFGLAFSPYFVARAFTSPGVQRSVEKPVPAARMTVTTDAPMTEQVGWYILGITDLNVASGSYTMDGYLNFKCSVPCNPPSPDTAAFDVMNSTGAPDISEQTSDTHGGTIHYYRVRVPLATNLNLVDFPFDYHSLSMQIEDKILGMSGLNYQFDPQKSGVDDFAVVSGWEVQKVVEGEVLTHDYHIYAEPYSRLVFNVSIFHPWFSSFMKGLFAAIVIVLVGMLSFLMKYNEIGERLALVSSTLVGAILYHLTLTSSIPPIGYLTFADKFMYANYVIIFIALTVTVRLMLHINADQEKLARRLHNYTRLLIPGVWVALMAYLIVFGMSIPLWEYIAKFGF